MPDLDLSPLGGANPVLLANACVPAALLAKAPPAGTVLDRDGCARLDLVLAEGRIAEIATPGLVFDGPRIDLEGRHLWPMLLDAHAHLDKGHIVDRAPNPSGDHPGAREATTVDRVAHWRRDDLLRRMDFGLACAEAHGVAAIRTHLDSHAGQAEETWAAFADVRDTWSSRVALQAVALVPVDAYGTDHGAHLADLVARHGGLLGGVTRASGGAHGAALDDLDVLLDRLFTLARDRDLDVDLHVDEAARAGALSHVARATIRHGYQGRVTCGHCCSLALLPEDEAAALIALVAEAGISIITLPTVNMYLQDRNAEALLGHSADRRTPRWRGVTPVHELRAASVRVAVAGDNCRDPFYAYGDHDMLDTFRQSLRILHLDHPYADAPALAGPAPAAIMGLTEHGAVGVGRVADLMLLNAWSLDQVVARPQSDRRLIRHGRPSHAQLPSYACLNRHADASAPRTQSPVGVECGV